MWWRTVHLGNLTFPSWSAVRESVTLAQVRSIFDVHCLKYLVVFKSLEANCQDIVGVISKAQVEETSSSSLPSSDSNSNYEAILQLPINQISNLISTNFATLQMWDAVVGDADDLFKNGFPFVILHRTSKMLTYAHPVQSAEQDSKTTTNDREESFIVSEKESLIAVLKEEDAINWIRKVEGHHNMN